MEVGNVQAVWLTGPGGVMSSHVGALRLVVRVEAHAPEFARFLVFRRCAPDGEALVGSGSLHSVSEAMRAAERMAEQCSGNVAVSKTLAHIDASA
jgi:hypothetical protein